MSLRLQLQNLSWLEPWALLPAKRAADLDRALVQGLGADHPLTERDPHAVAARVDTPDTLFLLSAPEQWCLVHLSKKREELASPQHTFFDGIEDFVDSVMRPDHLEDNDDEA